MPLQDLSPVIGRAIRQLPEAQQEVVDLSFFKGMSQREIAAERKISLGTVKTRLHLAQKKLYQSFQYRAKYIPGPQSVGQPDHSCTAG